MIILTNNSGHRAIVFFVPSPSSGLATLFFCLILLASATSLIFTVSRTSLAEQRIMNNEYRSETLRQACEAGLDYGLAWLRQHELDWQLDSTGQHSMFIPLPPDHLGLDNSIQVLVSIKTSDISSVFFQLQAQASQESNSLYRMGLFVHYRRMNGAGNNFSAQVVTVPGTWHDYGEK